MIHFTDINSGTHSSRAQATCEYFGSDEKVAVAIAVGNNTDALPRCMAKKQIPLIEDANSLPYDDTEYKQLAPYLYTPAELSLSRFEAYIEGLHAQHVLDDLALLQRGGEVDVNRVGDVGFAHFLTDTRLAAIPMILATGAVHVHLLRQQLRTFTSLNVRSGECLDVHHFAVLVGVGATTVNAYVAEASIADRHGRGLFGKLSLDECLDRYRKAVNEGLLKVMSKMGIAVVSSYRGGANFEALGLSRTLVAEYFPHMPSRISGIGTDGSPVAP